MNFASTQDEEVQKVFRRSKGTGVMVGTIAVVPRATEPCTAAEAEWWERLRTAANNLYKNSDEGSKKRFYLLMLEGRQNAYRVPVKDGPPYTLISGRMEYPEKIRRKGTEGTVVLSLEFRADGSIGDVQIVEGVVKELDEIAIKAARQMVFVPAVKNAAFVEFRGEQKYGFVLGHARPKK
jgi:TonB family protein